MMREYRFFIRCSLFIYHIMYFENENLNSIDMEAEMIMITLTRMIAQEESRNTSENIQ